LRIDRVAILERVGDLHVSQKQVGDSVPPLVATCDWTASRSTLSTRTRPETVLW
jgi:hypothetical protein